MPERNPFEETRQAAQDWSPRERYISRSNQDRIMPGKAEGETVEGINWRNYIGPDIRVGGGPGIENIERANMNIPWRMPPGPGEGRMRPTDPSLPPWYQDNLGSGEGSFWNVKADQPWQDSGVMLALANSPAINKIKNIYSQVDPFFPDIDLDDQQIGYDLDKNLWGGTLGFGGGYDMEDDAYNAYINWGTDW